MTHRKLILGAALAMVFSSGCIPEGEDSVRQEVDYVREAAFQDWRSARERGENETRADGPLSIDDAVKLALQYSKPLQKTVYNREVVRGQRMSAYGVVLPSARVIGGYTRAEKRGSYRNTDVDNYSAGLSVTQPLWQGSLIPATLRQAQLSVALTDEQIRESVQTLIQDVANTYYDILLAQHLVETHREALVSAEAQLRMTTERRRQETATDYDVLRAQVDVASYRAQMISEQNSVDSNRVQLLKLMGISQDSEITLSDKLTFLPMRPVFERAVEVASSNRPDVRQAEIEARVQQEAIRIAQSEFFPQVAANFSQDFGKTTTRSHGFSRRPWEAGINASLDFGIDNFGNLRRTRAEARQAEIELLNRQELTLMEIRQEMNNLTNSEEMVRSLEVNQDAAREALRLALVGYQAGVRTEVDVTDARRALTEVQGQYYSALTDHTKSRLNLQVAMGVLGPRFINDGTQMKPDIPIANIEEFAATDYTPPEPISIPGLRPTDRNTGRESQPEARSNGTRSRQNGSATLGGSSSSSTPSSRRTPSGPAAGAARRNPTVVEDSVRRTDEAIKEAEESVRVRPQSSAESQTNGNVTTAKITIKPDRSAVARATSENAPQ
ncbi:MAG: TolC family protein [Planctomycetaceae bacterium]|nr:TolC family protein [Planctomycetaceae bacterium]